MCSTTLAMFWVARLDWVGLDLLGHTQCSKPAGRLDQDMMDLQQLSSHCSILIIESSIAAALTVHI